MFLITQFIHKSWIRRKANWLIFFKETTICRERLCLFRRDIYADAVVIIIIIISSYLFIITTSNIIIIIIVFIYLSHDQRVCT